MALFRLNIVTNEQAEQVRDKLKEWGYEELTSNYFVSKNELDVNFKRLGLPAHKMKRSSKE